MSGQHREPGADSNPKRTQPQQAGAAAMVMTPAKKKLKSVRLSSLTDFLAAVIPIDDRCE